MKYKTILMILCCCGLSSCFLAPAVDSIRQAGVTKSDRMTLLPRHVKKYSEALHWGDAQSALAFATDQGRAKLAEQLSEFNTDTRIVESKIRNVDFDEDGYQAELDIVIKYYKIPYYVVNDRHEKQTWKFSYASGWLLDSAQLIKG